MRCLQITMRQTAMCAAVLILAVAGLAAVQVQSASATMCMVDCWDDDGGWSGGGGLGGGDGGGDPDDGIGGGNGDPQPGDIPDNSPSGTGWDDPRLAPHDSDILPPDTYGGVGGSGDAGTSSSTTSDYNQCIVNADTFLVYCQYRGNLVCSVIGGKIGGGKGGAAYGACYVAYDQLCRATHESGNVASCQRTKQCLDAGRPLSECGSAWFRISHGGDFADPWPNTETDDYDHGVCKAKPSLPQCEP